MEKKAAVKETWHLSCATCPYHQEKKEKKERRTRETIGKKWRLRAKTTTQSPLSLSFPLLLPGPHFLFLVPAAAPTLGKTALSHAERSAAAVGHTKGAQKDHTLGVPVGCRASLACPVRKAGPSLRRPGRSSVSPDTPRGAHLALSAVEYT